MPTRRPILLRPFTVAGAIWSCVLSTVIVLAVGAVALAGVLVQEVLTTDMRRKQTPLDDYGKDEKKTIA